MTERPRQLPFAPDGANWLRKLADTGRSDSTIDCYGRDLRDVAEATGHRDTRRLISLDQVAVDALAARWRDEGASEASVSRRFSALRGFAAYLVRERGMNLSVLLSADFPTAAKRTRPPVVEAEIGLLLSENPEGGWRDARDSALFAVESDAGLTPAETVKLNVGCTPPRIAECTVGNHDRRQAVWALLEAAAAELRAANWVPL